jgi:acyl-CoA synthetase (AMP-forming)/AMP-acid ligase II
VSSFDLENNRVVPPDSIGQSARRLVGSGRISAGQRVVIIDPERRVQCDQNSLGEIWVSGPSVATGYWNRPAETFRAFLTDTGEGPFLRTGDLGFIQDGELFVAGRIKDLIIIDGRNHYPQDIEQTVEASHPAIRPICSAAFSIMFTKLYNQVAHIRVPQLLEG